MLDMQDFHFLRPEWLWALVPLALLVLALRYLHRSQSGWQAVLAGHLYQHLVTTKGGRGNRPSLFLLALGWLLATVALAGPTWEQLPQPVYQLNTGKVVVLDMSLSMRATDVTPDRLTRAKFKAIDLVQALNEGDTGLVAYAGDAFTISPLSSDAQTLAALIPSLSPEIMPVAGSEPFLGLQSAVQLLSNAGYQQGEIFWITDGIENGQVTEVRQLLQSAPYRLSVLAIGTEDGAPIKLTNDELLKDARGAIVIPRLTEANLKLLARTGGGRYAPMQADDSDIRYLTEQTLVNRDVDDPGEQDNQQGDQWKEMGPYLLLLLLPIAAYGFRRGLVTVMLLALLPGFTPQAQANWWDDMWKTPDQQGQEAFTQQQYDRAAEAFEDPLWQGAAHYRSGNYEAALDAFSQSDSIEARYNQGNALAQLGEIDQAIAAYEDVLAAQPDHADALANKALLEQQKQQQEQQQQQQDNQQQQDQEQNQQQDNQQQQQNDQSQQQDGQQGQSDQSEQQPSEQEPEDSDSEGEAEQQQEEQEQQQQQDANEAGEQESQQAEERPLTDEEKEQMQRLQNLLRKVPDDPAYLLKRKMLLEHQQRRRDRVPTQLQRNW